MSAVVAAGRRGGINGHSIWGVQHCCVKLCALLIGLAAHCNNCLAILCLCAQAKGCRALGQADGCGQVGDVLAAEGLSLGVKGLDTQSDRRSRVLIDCKGLDHNITRVGLVIPTNRYHLKCVSNGFIGNILPYRHRRFSLISKQGVKAVDKTLSRRIGRCLLSIVSVDGLPVFVLNINRCSIFQPYLNGDTVVVWIGNGLDNGEMLAGL